MNSFIRKGNFMMRGFWIGEGRGSRECRGCREGGGQVPKGRIGDFGLRIAGRCGHQNHEARYFYRKTLSFENF